MRVAAGPTIFQLCDDGLTLIYDELCKNYLDSPYQNINEVSQAGFVTSSVPEDTNVL